MEVAMVELVKPLGAMSRRSVLRTSLALAAGAGLPSWLPGRAAADGAIREVVVVGAGLSGLMAAYLLSDRDVLVLEKEAAAGGRICAGTWGEFRYSMGAAYMGTPEGDMRRFFTEIGVEPIPVPPPVDAMAVGGTIYPEEYFAAALGSQDVLQDYARMAGKLAELSEGGIEEALYSVDLEAIAGFESLDKLTMEQWLAGEGIDPVVRNLVDVENRGLFGVGNRDFSLLYDIPEMAYNFYEPGLARETIPEGPVPDFHSYTPHTDVGLVDTWTFPGGMMEVVDAMIARADLSSRLETGATVTRVAVNRDETVTVTYKQGGRTRKVKAYAAVIATPAAVTSKIVRSGLSREVKAALQSIPYTTYVTMALFTSQRLIRNAWNVACLDACFTTLNDAVRTQVPTDYHGKAILGVAMPPKHAGDRSLIGMRDEDLVELALADIERYLPGARDKVLGYDVKRFHHAFPVFGPGYADILRPLHGDASTRGPLFLAGDYMVYPTLGGAAVSGDLANAGAREYAEDLASLSAPRRASAARSGRV